MKELNLNQYFDHTLLKPDATKCDIKKLCDEAKKYHFYAVCVNSNYVQLAVNELKGSGIRVACVVGFPLGVCETEIKAFEAGRAVQNGADEIDMVINVGALKEKSYEFVTADIKYVVEACKDKALIKVILETCLLKEEEIIKACQLAKAAGAHFVKTSTGFLGEGAKVENVRLMKQTLGDSLQIKASGGIRDLKTTLKMIEAGADRIGASASVEIMEEYNQIKDKG